ncbi:hypothetical protein [Allobranchiibius huperziae]|uniref:Uncharacterized protein n=1 Tax=Allobranchiibius huperziae TaxID=1874116 RepID=A0A853DIQ8_9MICO|nr:hypothetical protein [Allobranchiibius huperziae]NYJ76587.1 hypothetical protein [Allobranchiibius huperziae]
MTIAPQDLERLDRLGAWLIAHDGHGTKRDFADALDLDGTQRRRILNHAGAAGWIIEPDRSTVALTPEGRARFGGLATGSAGALLDTLLDGWPARHRALAQLAACAILARRLDDDAPRVGFALIGGTGTGKTATAAFLARLFGHEPDRILVNLSTATDRPSGRRLQTGGTWTYEPSTWTSGPLVCLDEWDKTTDTARADLFATALHPAGRALVEDQVHAFAAVPILTANTPHAARGLDRLRTLGSTKMAQPVQRRCITLDTGARSQYDATALQRVTDAYRWHPQAADRLPLDDLPIPDSCDEDLAAMLNQHAHEALTETGLETFPGAHALEPLARVRRTLLPDDAPAPLAAALTMADYLTVTESLPEHVRPGWSDGVALWCQQMSSAPGVAGLAHALTSAAQAREATDRADRAARVQTATAGDALTRAAAELAAECKTARDHLDGRRLIRATDTQRVQAAGLRRLLGTLHDSAARTHTAVALEDLRDRATPHLRDAAALRAAVAHTEQQAAARKAADAIARREQREQDKHVRAAAVRAQRDAERMARTHARQTRTYRREQLRQLRAYTQPLERLYARTSTGPNESPLRDLAQITHPATGAPLLTFAPYPVKNGWGRALEVVAGSLARVETPTGDWSAGGQRFPGTPTSCADLSTWGPHTRAVLAPLLAHLHAGEDALTNALSEAPRAARPHIAPTPAPRAITTR